jgi:hypothetical protein
MAQQQAGRSQQQAGYLQAQQGASIQAEAARQQAGISRDQAATSVIYAGQDRDLNIQAANQSAAASTASLALSTSTVQAQQRIEAQRRSAMELDARRNQLEIVRNQQRARALGLSNATHSGTKSSSGLQGAYGQVSGQTGVNLLGVQQNLQIGQNIFDQNANISSNNIAMAQLQNNYALQQAANQTTKSNLVYNLASANAGFQTRMADTQTLASQGSGMVAMGQGQAQMGAATSNAGSSFISAGQNIFSMGTNIDKLFPSFSSNIFGNNFSSFNPFSYTG